MASDSSPPSLEELSFRGVAALFLPLILSMEPPREVTVFLHPSTGSMTILEGAPDVDSQLPFKQGPSPATKASIDALPRVRVSDPGLECSICLAEYEVNGGSDVKQMPCGHKFHAGCIDKWLGMHGSCPVCRFSMPAVEENEERYESGGFRIHVFVFQERGDVDSGEAGTDRDEDTGIHDDADDDEFTAQDMDLDYID